MKYDIKYFQCGNCGFIQTEKVFWLKEAYGNAITSLDIGILDRNNFLLKNVTKIIDICFPKSKIYLDFAGAYHFNHLVVIVAPILIYIWIKSISDKLNNRK